MINIVTSSRYTLNKKQIKQFAQECLVVHGTPNSLVNIVFVGKRKMTEIATTYKDEPVALPVLAFTFKEKQEDEHLLGEVFICYPQAVLLAAERHKRVDEMMGELIEHGINNLFK